MVNIVNAIKKSLKHKVKPGKKNILQRFFKTGPGEYGAGDVFLGVMVPQIREVVADYWKQVDLKDIEKLLKSKIHEERLCALLLLVKAYVYSEAIGKEQIVRFYLSNTKYINNWDLVDLTAPRILGDYLINKPRDIIYDLSKSSDLWEKRIAVLACFAFIRIKDFKDILKLSAQLLKEEHDLMHKAVGWMLREVGKKDEKVLLRFLDKHCKEMPRTMLRYSIERLSDSKKKYYMEK
jgi:3-methyladenine DNA glycosylase AlkD